MQIYLARNNQQAGPYTVEQLNQMLASQQVVLSDLIWHQGMSEWKPLGEVTQGQQHYYPEGYQAPSATNSPFESTASSSIAAEQAKQASQLAPFSKRIFAKIIDMLLWIPVCIFPPAFMSAEQHAATIKIQATAGLIPKEETQSQLFNLIPQSAWIAILIYVVLMFVVQAILLTKTGQSVGKKVMGIVIVDIDTEQKVGLNRVFILRSLLFVILTFTPASFITTIVDCSFALFNNQRQALHDRLCKTKVIEKKN